MFDIPLYHAARSLWLAETDRRAEAVWLTGDEHTAGTLRRHLHETGRGRLLEDRHVIVTIGTGYLGSWHRTLRLLAATLSVGGSDKALRNEAVRQLTAALGAHRAVGAVGFEIRTHLDLAAVEAAGGKDAAFENHLEAARSLAREHDLAAILSRRDFRP